MILICGRKRLILTIDAGSWKKVVLIKKKDVYKGISGDVGKWFDIKFCWKKKKATITCKKKTKND